MPQTNSAQKASKLNLGTLNLRVPGKTSKSKTDLARLRRASEIIMASPEHFESEFYAWLADNWHVYLAFEKIANETSKVVGHYGAKCIWEVMRYNSTVKEQNSDFKLNNNWSYSCARLYVALNPSQKGFFNFRVRKALERRMSRLPNAPHVRSARNALETSLPH